MVSWDKTILELTAVVPSRYNHIAAPAGANQVIIVGGEFCKGDELVTRLMVGWGQEGPVPADTIIINSHGSSYVAYGQPVNGEPSDSAATYVPPAPISGDANPGSSSGSSSDAGTAPQIADVSETQPTYTPAPLTTNTPSNTDANGSSNSGGSSGNGGNVVDGGHDAQGTAGMAGTALGTAATLGSTLTADPFAPTPTSTTTSSAGRGGVQNIAPLTLGLTVGLISFFLVLGLALLLLWWCVRRRREQRKLSDGQDGERLISAHRDMEKGGVRHAETSRSQYADVGATLFDNDAPHSPHGHGSQAQAAVPPTRSKSVLQRLGTKIWRTRQQEQAYRPLRERPMSVVPAKTADHFDTKVDPLPFEGKALPSRPKPYNPDDALFSNMYSESGDIGAAHRGPNLDAATAVLGGPPPSNSGQQAGVNPFDSYSCALPLTANNSLTESARSALSQSVETGAAVNGQSNGSLAVAAAAVVAPPVAAGTVSAMHAVTGTTSRGTPKQSLTRVHTQRSTHIHAWDMPQEPQLHRSSSISSLASCFRNPTSDGSTTLAPTPPPKIGLGSKVEDVRGKTLSHTAADPTHQYTDDPFADSEDGAPLLVPEKDVPQGARYSLEKILPNPSLEKIIPAPNPSPTTPLFAAAFGGSSSSLAPPSPSPSRPPLGHAFGNRKVQAAAGVRGEFGAPSPVPTLDLRRSTSPPLGGVGSMRSAASHSSVFGAFDADAPDLSLGEFSLAPLVMVGGSNPSPAPSPPPSPSPESSPLLPPRALQPTSTSEVSAYYTPAPSPMPGSPKPDGQASGVLDKPRSASAFSSQENREQEDEGEPLLSEEGSHEALGLYTAPAGSTRMAPKALPHPPMSPAHVHSDRAGEKQPTITQSRNTTPSSKKIRRVPPPSLDDLERLERLERRDKPAGTFTLAPTFTSTPSFRPLAQSSTGSTSSSEHSQLLYKERPKTSSRSATQERPKTPSRSTVQDRPKTPARSTTTPLPSRPGAAVNAPSTPTRHPVRQPSLASLAAARLRPGQEGYVSTIVGAINLRQDTPESMKSGVVIGTPTKRRQGSGVSGDTGSSV